MTLALHNGFSMPFLGTGGTQTITLTTSGTATGDGGIEQYVLASGDDTFKVAPDSGAFKQNVDISKGGKDIILYGSPFSGNLVGADADDTVQFLPGGGDVDISEVNGGAATGAGKASFSDAALTVLMTLVQHNGFGTPFIDTADTQTIALATGGTATGDAGIENYVVVGEEDYTFVFAKDDVGLVGGSQNLDLVDPDVFNDTIVFGAGTFSGMLKNAGKGDTVQFSGGAASVAGVNLGLAFGPDAVASLSNAAVDVTMTLAQHNGLAMPFLETAGTQTITLATDGTTTGDIGVEHYVLGEDESNSNEFTIGILNQSVTGRKDDDVIINPFGGPTGILLGGANDALGDTLVLKKANTELKAGSGGFENLTIAAAGSSTLKMNNAAHSGFTGVINAPGTDDTIILTTAISGPGLLGIESYQLISSTGTNFFFFTDSQTGTVSGADNRADNFLATASQIANVSLLYGGAGTNTGNLIITTDAAGLDLATRTKNINVIQLSAGASANVIGANNFGGNQVSVTAFADTIYTMGSGGFQAYLGAVGRDDVTFTTPTGAYQLGPSADVLRSKVGGAITAVLVDGGDGTDTFALSAGDDISGIAQFMNFEDLTLADNASVTMKNAQHNMFVGASTIAPGNETITITDTFVGTTMKNVENYKLLGTLNNATVAYSGQTIDSNSVSSTISVNNGLDSVKIAATLGLAHIVFLDANTTLDVALNGLISDTVDVRGTITGSIQVGDGAGVFDALQLNNGANISGASVGIGANTFFEDLVLEDNGTFTMTAAQYIDLTTAPGGVVIAGGVETVIITTSSGSTIESRNNIENYILSGVGNDTFHYNMFSGSGFTLNIAAGGNDTFVLDNSLLTEDVEQITVTGFSVAGDKVSSFVGATNISNGAFQTVVAMDTDLAAATDHFVINTTVGTLTDPTDLAAVRALVAFAIKVNAAEQDFTVAIYDAAGHADLYQMHIKASADVAAADITLVDYGAQLTGITANTLIGTNFV
jgi:hypothetical protein